MKQNLKPMKESLIYNYLFTIFLVLFCFFCATSSDCGDNYFQCPSSRVCLHRYLRCNGKVDCADGTDEVNCKDEGEIFVIDH